MSTELRYKHIEKSRSRHGRVTYYYRPSKDVPRIRLPDTYGSEDFLRAYRDAALLPPPTFDNKQATLDALKKGIARAKGRSVERGLEFDLTVEWATDLAEKQGFRCAMTGVQFYAPFVGGSKCHPYVPSFDRIDTKGGYTKDNVRLVCFAINAMMLDWGEELFSTVVGAYAQENPLTLHNEFPAPNNRNSFYPRKTCRTNALPVFNH